MSRKIDEDLRDACREGKIHDVERLIKEGANVCRKYGYWIQTPLHLAAENGHEPIISALLSHGVDCNVADEWGQTPLHLAAENGHESVVSALPPHGADCNVADYWRRTPLYLAAENGHEPVVSALLSHGADCNIGEKWGQTPLHLAAENGHEPVVSALLSHGVDHNVADNDGRTPLHLAAWDGHEPVVSALLSHGVDHNVADNDRATPLHLAARNDHGPVVSALLSHGADPNVADKSGASPLHLAARNGRGPGVSALLSYGADPNVADKSGASPLHLAARNGRGPDVSALLSYGADPNVADKSRKSPLHLAAMRGHGPVVSALLSSGANVNVTDHEGATPLHLAARNGLGPGVSALLSHGADPNVADKSGATPLHWAVKNYYESGVSALLSHGADLNVADKSGATPLHWAVKNYNESGVSALLSDGADINVADKSGATPLHWAVENNNGRGVSALLSHGADLNVADKSGKTPYDVCSRYTTAWELLREALQFPRELQYLSVQDDDTFTNTLKSGYYESHVGKLMCVGPEGVGKTAIVSVLRDVKPSETRIPTEGIDLHTYKAAINTEAMEWVPSELKAEDVAIRDLLLEPKQTEQVSTAKFDYDDHLSHDSESIKNEQVDKGAFLLDKSEETRTKVTVKSQPSNQNIAEKDAIDKRETGEINQPRKDDPKYKSIYLLKEVQEYAKSKKGLLERALAPVNMMDFGGQAAFYSTHQSFLTYRGLYVLVLDGSKDFDEVIDTDDFIPGRHGKPTSREFTFFWVSSILAYSKGGSRNFPKILVVLTHRDKVPSNEADQKAQHIFLEIEKMFSNTPAEKHLILKPRIFLKATNPNDPGYNTLKQVIVQEMCSQPSWGEKLPKAWIPLKMIINQKVEQGELIMSLDELQAVNELNPVQKLSEGELATFLKIHHAQGEIIYFQINGLKDHIIISPEFLVAALRSLVTDKRFCQGRRMKTLESINESGVLSRSDIEYIWDGDKRFIPHKQYLLSLLSHLDIIATPRNYGQDGSLLKSNIYFVPCLVKGVVDPSVFELNFERRSIGLSFRFESKTLPPAVGYRLMASCIDMYPIREYNGKSMLFSGLVTLCVNRIIDLLMILRSDRIDFYLVHEQSKEGIPKPIAFSTLECLKDILVNILESYRKTSSEGKYALRVPFHEEYPCYELSSPCYDTDRTRSSPKCKHGHALSLEEKKKWFMDTKEEPIKAQTINECPSTGQPSLKPNEKPTDRQLANISTQMEEGEMLRLVLHLGLKVHEIEAIKFNNPGNLMNIKFLMLQKWKQSPNSGSIEELVKAAENENITFDWKNEINRSTPIPEWIDLSEQVNDQILDSVANKIINESLLFTVYLGLDPSIWIGLKADRCDIYKINREVLKKWKESDDNSMKDLVQAMCNVGNIAPLIK